jgi:hypothetical protein
VHQEKHKIRVISLYFLSTAHSVVYTFQDCFCNITFQDLNLVICDQQLGSHNIKLLYKVISLDLHLKVHIQWS